MQIKTEFSLNPAVEVIMFFDRTFSEDIPNTLEAGAAALSEKYSITREKMRELVEPLLPLEAELRELLLPREDLWGAMFYPDSRVDNQLAWALFFLEQEGITTFDLTARQRLLALTLNCALTDVEQISTMEALTDFLWSFSCEERLKWVCIQVWRQPELFLEKYRQLVALAEPVIRRHDQCLRPMVRRAMEQMEQAMNQDPGKILSQLGMNTLPRTGVILASPMANNFNGAGMIWDHTRPDSSAYLMMGILRSEIGELISRFGENSEFLADRLKSLSDLRRIEIMKALKTAPMYGQELAELLSLSPATISHHMNTLVSAGFVAVNRRGVKTSYTVDKQNLSSFLKNLQGTLL